MEIKRAAELLRGLADGVDPMTGRPLPDETRETEVAWLNGSSEPDIIYYDIGDAPEAGTTQQADSASGE